VEQVVVAAVADRDEHRREERRRGDLRRVNRSVVARRAIKTAVRDSSSWSRGEIRTRHVISAAGVASVVTS